MYLRSLTPIDVREDAGSVRQRYSSLFGHETFHTFYLVTWCYSVIIQIIESIGLTHQHKLEKYEDLREQHVQNGCTTNTISLKIWCRGFLDNSLALNLPRRLMCHLTKKRNQTTMPLSSTLFISKTNDKSYSICTKCWSMFLIQTSRNVKLNVPSGCIWMPS